MGPWTVIKNVVIDDRQRADSTMETRSMTARTNTFERAAYAHRGLGCRAIDNKMIVTWESDRVKWYSIVNVRKFFVIMSSCRTTEHITSAKCHRVHTFIVLLLCTRACVRRTCNCVTCAHTFTARTHAHRSCTTH